MFLLNICICAGLVLSLPKCVYQLCTRGERKQCKDADFAPGTHLAGDGFDITKMERKFASVLNMSEWLHKDQTCVLCTNPYLENKQQKIPLSVVNWSAEQSCSVQVSSSLYRSSESLVSSNTYGVENNWQVDLGFDVAGKSSSLMLAGTSSNIAGYSMGKTKDDKFSFTSQSMTCEYYNYGVTSTPKLHTEFKKALKHLPKLYSRESKRRFYELIDNFGTHYISKVRLGGYINSVTSIKECQARLQGFSSEEIQMCLEAEASVSIKAKAKVESKHCKTEVEKTDSKSAFSSRFSDRFTETRGGHTSEPDLLFSGDKDPSAYKAWLQTLPSFPGMVKYSLKSLHELLPINTPARKNLRSAIRHYILEKGLWRNCSGLCQAGVRSDSKDPCVCQCHNEPAVNSYCCPTRKGMARVIITVQHATGLWGDDITATDGFVKVFFNGVMVGRSRIINNNNNPVWNEPIDLGSQDLSSGQKVRFQVWDQDSSWDDDLLGQCERDLTAGDKQDVCTLQNGRLYYKLEVKCAPSLSGNSCMEYKPTPMSQSLKRLYVSRHAQPVPKAILLEMGVIAD